MLRADPEGLGYREERARIFEEKLASAWLVGNQALEADITEGDGPSHRIVEGDSWGEPWSTARFHVRGRVPDEWIGKIVVAEIDVGGEALVRDAEGRPLTAISPGSVYDGQFRRRWIPVTHRSDGGQPVEWFLDATAAGLFGLNRPEAGAETSGGSHGDWSAVVHRLRLRIQDDDAYRLWLEFSLLRSIYEALAKEETRSALILRALDHVADGWHENGDAAACRRILSPLLSASAGASALRVSAVGHAHLDLAWLWPVEETRRKAVRTFAAQADLLERNPGFHFGASQPWLYRIVREAEPELAARVRELVQAGRWECQGAFFVECDANMVSGESLVRQILHGLRTWEEETGAVPENVWLPDIFGFPASMPQIIKKAGLKGLITQKISWSKFNPFPHHSFRWRGIDGSDIPVHFLPENTYNSTLQPSQLILAARRFREKSTIGVFLSLFGVGDGGGGPRQETIDRASYLENVEGVPRVSVTPASRFVDELSDASPRLPIWDGELYLEFHRGTFTTQSEIKYLNRRLEEALRVWEWLAVSADRWPEAPLRRLREISLFHQFHDILPGSGIARVNREAREAMSAALEECREEITEIVKTLGRGDDECFSLVNSLSSPWSGAISLPEGWRAVVDDDGTVWEGQRREDGKSVIRCTVPSQGAAVFRRAEIRNPDKSVKGKRNPVSSSGSRVLENNLIRYEFDPAGRLLTAYDREEGREIIPDGEYGNHVRLYEDTPIVFDAWDIDPYYEGQLVAEATLADRSPLQRGPVYQGFRQRLDVAGTAVDQEICLIEGSKRLDFRLSVDWRENRRMLRVAFPVAIRAERAAFEIPFGHYYRPTHANTSWDIARYEVPALRFADLSDAGYGAALINDVKHGYKVRENVLDLTLLRSTTNPDPDADRGIRRFGYAFLPHRGDLPRSTVRHEAEAFNAPPVEVPGRDLGGFIPAVRLEGSGLTLEAVKRAEDGSGDLVARVLEVRGGVSTGRLFPSLGSYRAALCDLRERPVAPWIDIDGDFTLRAEPFEILTIRLSLREHERE